MISVLKCDRCQAKWQRDNLDHVTGCPECSAPVGHISPVEPVSDGKTRALCLSCDWDIVLENDEYTRPTQTARARADLHGAQIGHQVLTRTTSDRTVETPELGDLGWPTSEQEVQDGLEQFFEKMGWTALTEVSPHHSDYRADLIVKSDEYGWFGAEIKYFDTTGASKVADAHHQIVAQYRGKKYLGNRINRWVLIPYFAKRSGPGATTSLPRRDLLQFSRELCCRHGVGIVDLTKAKYDHLVLDFAYSRSECKVPVGHHEYAERHHDNVDMDAIDEMIERKMDRLNY